MCAVRYREGRKLGWIVYYNNPFSGKRCEVGFASRDEALREDSLIKHRLKFERDWFRESPDSDANDLPATLRDGFLAYLADRKFESIKSVQHVRLSMTIPLQLLQHKPLANITKQDIEQVMELMASENIKPVTVRGRMTILYAVLRWCYSKGMVDRLPAFPKLPSPTYEHFIPPTEEELQKIYKAASPQLKRVIILASQLGVRVGPSELNKLTWNDVDFNKQTIKIQAAKKNIREPWREIPFSDELKEVLIDWKKEDDALNCDFPVNVRGTHIKTYLKNSWKTALRRAGISRRIRMYDLRHLFATNLIDAGIDIGTVTKLMGHSSPTTLMKYYQHVSDLRKREAINALPSVRKLRIPSEE